MLCGMTVDAIQTFDCRAKVGLPFPRDSFPGTSLGVC